MPLISGGYSKVAPHLGAMLLLSIGLDASTGAAAAASVSLRGDFLAMDVVPGTGPAGLIVFTEAPESVGAAAGPQNSTARMATLYRSRDGVLSQGPGIGYHTGLPAEVAAYDICPPPQEGDRNTQDHKDTTDHTVIVATPKGILTLPDLQPLVSRSGILAHAPEDMIPRVRMCQRSSGSPYPMLLLPDVHEVHVFHKSAPEAAYALLGSWPLPARSRMQQAQDRRYVQEGSLKVQMSFEFPEIRLLDFDGDGADDLCMGLAESLVCWLGDKKSGLKKAVRKAFQFRVLTDGERRDSSIRMESRLIDVNGDGRLDLVLKKSTWNISDAGSSLYFFLQKEKVGFVGNPDQTISRKGYFAWQDFRDLNGDGLPEMIAPVADLGWSDLAGIFFSRQVSMDFVVFANKGMPGGDPRLVYSMSFPVNFKNLSAISGALPIWDFRFGPAAGGRSLVFFPGMERVEIRTFGRDGNLSSSQVNRAFAVGPAVAAADFNQDGSDELVFAYPRDEKRRRQLMIFDPVRPGPE